MGHCGIWKLVHCGICTTGLLQCVNSFQVVNASKLRVDLRLFAELVSVGIFTERVGLGQLANQLLYLVSNDKEEHHNLAILLSFTKHCGDDYAGLVPRRFRWENWSPWVFLPEASFGLWVLSLPTSVCVCISVSACQPWACPHDNLWPIQARITKFGSEVQNTLVKITIVLGWNWPWF